MQYSCFMLKVWRPSSVLLRGKDLDDEGTMECNVIASYGDSPLERRQRKLLVKNCFYTLIEVREGQ